MKWEGIEDDRILIARESWKFGGGENLTVEEGGKGEKFERGGI